MPDDDFGLNERPIRLKDLLVEEARARMLAAAAPGAPERIALDRTSLGRVLAEPVTAIRDQPPFDASAMDGYALHPADPAWPRFTVAGESAAGRPFAGLPVSGQAVRVFTGASVPRGCAVVVQELAQREGDTVVFTGDPPALGSYVRQRGGDFHAGAALLAAGVRLDAWRLSLAAAAGRAHALVFPQPRVVILSTGDEIAPAGSRIGEAQIFECIGSALAALIAQWGGRPQPPLLAGDTAGAVLAAVDAMDAELIVVIGGASVGDYDLVKPALAARGLVLAVETVRLRPGKPTWFGVLADGRRVLGLPGNPASGLVTAELFLRPLLMAWQGGDPALPMQHARLGHPLAATGPREHWMRGRLASQVDGTMRAQAFPDQDSSLVSVFAAADALIRRPADAPRADEGDVVEVLRLARL